jgi:hypothetical protein
MIKDLILLLSLTILLSACGISEKAIRSTLEVDVANKVSNMAMATVRADRTKAAATITAFKNPTYTPYPTYTPNATYTPVNTLTPLIYGTQLMVMVTITNTPTKTLLPTNTPIPTRTQVPTRTQIPTRSVLYWPCCDALAGSYDDGVIYEVGKAPNLISGIFYDYAGGGLNEVSCILRMFDYDGKMVYEHWGSPKFSFFVPKNVHTIFYHECGSYRLRK